MKINTEPLKSWFGFTRRERRAAFTLLIIIILIIGLRYIIPERQMVLEDVSEKVSLSDTVQDMTQMPVKSYIKKARVNGPELASVRAHRSFLPGEVRSSKQERRRIDLNTCDSAGLVSLPGIGPVLSARIIKYRKLLGGFARVSQLKEVYGLPPETFIMIKKMVFADSSLVTRVDINKGVFKDLLRIPYIEKYEITAILKYRELKGRITGTDDLTDNKLVTAEKATKIKPYLNFGDN